MKKILFLIIMFIVFPISINAEEITDKCRIIINDEEYEELNDKTYLTYHNFSKDEILEIKCDEKINSIYILYEDYASKGHINNQIIGENGYLHELITIKEKEKNIEINYDEDYKIAEIYVFNNDDYPEWVENWQTLKKADLMLFAAHSDDEHLFFAGLLPTYIDKGYDIQVVYFTNHYNEKVRYHEQLEGLWRAGVKYYSVTSYLPDSWSISLIDARINLEEEGYTLDDAIKYEVEQIRKYKPLVVVTHDEKGEYGHGQHRLCSYTVETAIFEATNEMYDEESYEKYGIWNINKLYVHSYPKHQIVLDYDIPLDSYDGETAYFVSRHAYEKHVSQYKYNIEWFAGENEEYTTVTDIQTCNPAYFGLFYTNVGYDKNKNDMFENIKTNKSKEIKVDALDKIISKYGHNTKIYFNIFKDYLKSKATEEVKKITHK